MLIKKNLELVMDFAEWLKTNRAASRLSLRSLAKKIDYLCSDAYLSQLENRRYKGKKGKLMQPDQEIVIALAGALNKNIDEALMIAGYAPRESVLPDELRGIDFSIFKAEGLRQIKNYIEFLQT